MINRPDKWVLCTSTARGNVAYDGEGGHSPFTEALMSVECGLFQPNVCHWGERAESASPIEVPSLSPTPADEALAEGGTRTRSSSPSSSRSDFGPFSALRSFDDADPRELAGESWDSDADWGFGGPEPCGSDVDGRDKAKPRRQKDSAAAAAPIRRSKRRRDPWALGSTLGSPSDPQDLGVREGVIRIGWQSTASPTDARSFSPIPPTGL